MTSLTCYRLKETIGGQVITALDDFVDAGSRRVEMFGPLKGRNFSANLYVADSPPREPPWIEFLRAGFSSVPVRRSASTAALLIVRAGRKPSSVFAFAFGAGGRFLLRDGAWVRGYGLRVALNLIYPRDSAGLDETSRLVAVDTKTRGSQTVRSRRQTAQATAFETFDVDRMRDVVNAATGRPADAGTWGPRVSGSDALHLDAEGVTIGSLGDLCLRIEAAHRQTDYQDHFRWIDFIQPITDDDTLSELEAQVLTLIRSQDASLIELGPPEVVDWDRVRSFRYHFEVRKGVSRPELRLAHYLRGVQQHTPLDELDVPALRHRHIEAIDGDGAVVHRWTVWRCLDGEVSLGGETYVLDDGDFFRVTADFLGELNAYVDDLDEPSTVLIGTAATTRESDYNEAIAETNADVLLLDRKTITTGASTTPVEVCDLLSASRELIHVKRHLGARDLSHLFSQGAVSAELLHRQTAFRAEVKDLIGGLGAGERFNFFEPDGLTTSNFRVIYAIIANWRNRSLSSALPFFSKVNLRRAAEDLRDRGFGVGCVRVPEL